MLWVLPYNGQKVGTFGDIATLSFYPAHHITMGEGGAVFTNNAELKTIAESFRDWGRDCYCAPGCDNTCKLPFFRNNTAICLLAMTINMCIRT